MKFSDIKIEHETGWWWISLPNKIRSLKPYKYKIIKAWSWGPFLINYGGRR